MKNQLLILKSPKGYIRIIENGFQHCDMNKATVFPLSSIDEVIEKQQKIITLGELDAEIYMLTITEEKYTGKK